MPGLFIAAGMNSNGILNSGGVGLTMAAWMTDGPATRHGSMLAARAHPFQRNAAYNAERVTEASVCITACTGRAGRWKLRAASAGCRCTTGSRRRARCCPNASAGRCRCISMPGAGWPTRAGLGWQDWSPVVQAECLAARDAAVLIDQSMYGKIIVQGPDAVRALNRVGGAQMDVALGTSVYTQFLNAAAVSRPMSPSPGFGADSWWLQVTPARSATKR